MKKTLVMFLCLAIFVGICGAVSAATISGLVTVTRDASRAIVSAVIETSNRDNSGSPVIYNIVMDENGRAIAQQYENNEVNIEGAVSGKDITADTWSRVKRPPGSEPAYSEPEPEPEEEEVEEEEEEEEKSEEDSEKEPDEEKDEDSETEEEEEE